MRPLYYCLYALILASLSSCEFDFHKVRIELSVPQGEKGDTYYISGNDLSLGSWEADKVKLKGGPDLYYIDLRVPTGIELEYKFTRGSWATEALNEAGEIPANHTLIVRSDTSVQYVVRQWKSADYVAEGQVVGERIALDIPTIDGLAERQVWIWLPPNYDADRRRGYPLLVMHDGQNVFEPSGSLSGQEWRVDEVADSMIRADLIEPFVVVALANSPDRNKEYSYGEQADAYANYIIENVLPLVRDRFAIADGPQNTTIMGSSMGGLSSFVLAWEHPEVFGKAACLSPAFKIGPYDYVAEVQKKVLPQPMPALYFDNGTEELEAELQPGIDEMMAYLSEERVAYEWYLDQGALHNEAAWANRLHIPLRWLFAKRRAD
ncbi:MAG: alpha/beta hydrolase-fold protein [Bacteroidota bacterium]